MTKKTMLEVWQNLDESTKQFLNTVTSTPEIQKLMVSIEQKLIAVDRAVTELKAYYESRNQSNVES